MSRHKPYKSRTNSSALHKRAGNTAAKLSAKPFAKPHVKLQAKHRYAIAVVVLTLLVLALRLAVSFEVAQPGYESYFALIQAESIRETGLPRYDDPYSYQGRRYAFDPAFYYVISLATLFLPETLAVKLLPNLFMVLLIPLVYLLSHALTKKRGVSFLAAFFASFSPALFTLGINQATPLSFALPLLAATLLALVELEEHSVRALIFTALLTLVSPLVWLLLFAEVAYLLILAAEKLKVTVADLEVALVTLLMAAWYTLLTYKQALFMHGIDILAQSLPETVRTATFEHFTFLAMLYAVGVIPLAMGSLALYYTTFEQRSRKVLFIASLGLITLLAAVLVLIPLELALVLLSLVFAILAGPGLHGGLLQLRKTKFECFTIPLSILIIIFFLLTSFLPGLVTGLYPGSSPTPSELNAIAWIRNSTSEDSVIAASPKTGFLINHVAQRAYLADEAYLLIANPDEVLADIDELYTTPRTVAAITLTDKYGVTDILVGPQVNQRYPELGAIITDTQCFPRLYMNAQVFVLGVNCTLFGGGR